MLPAPIPDNESQRIAALRALNVLDSQAEERFDRITRLVRRMFDVPICLVSLVDENRQWFKSCQGLSVRETSRDISFCGHAVNGNEIFIISDTFDDARFFDNPLVTQAPFIRFYAGYPLTLKGGCRVGTLCVIDTKPRNLSKEERESLTDFGKMVEAELMSITENTLDPLTAISNRRGFSILAQKALASCDRTGQHATLVYFDLDYFKDVNDQHGHHVGDIVLKDFSKILTNVFRESDVIGRLGGDEFVVLLSGTTQELVDNVMSRFELMLASYNERSVLPVKIASSYGLAPWVPGAGVSLSELMASADSAMYQQKAAHHQEQDK